MVNDPRDDDVLPVDIDLERRREIDELHEKLEQLSLYEVLGIDPSADKKAIKRAFFGLVTVMHPDRYFGKRLGSYRAKLDVIFARVALASETLSDPVRRAEYDANTGILSVRASAPMPSSSPPDVSAPKPSPSPRHGKAVQSQTVSAPPATINAPPATGPSPEEVERRRRIARDALRQRFGDPAAMANQKADTLRRHIEAAAAARAAGDLESAAASLRLATALAPDDPELSAAHEAARLEADERLAESHVRQALLEERYGHWAEAAASWERVLELRPSDITARARFAEAKKRIDAGK